MKQSERKLLRQSARLKKGDFWGWVLQVGGSPELVKMSSWVRDCETHASTHEWMHVLLCVHPELKLKLRKMLSGL